MSTLLTINVTNNQAQTSDFYFFQEPANYQGGPLPYSNSLFSQPLSNHGDSGSILTFQANMQFYAGIQQANSSIPAVGSVSGFVTATREIDLAEDDGSGSRIGNDSTTATVFPALGLSPTKHTPGVQKGAFRIITPSFNTPPFYNVGSAVCVNGSMVLSSFVQAKPNNYIDCEPILKFYVATGSYTPGAVMDFTQSSSTAAVCDFTNGYTTADVILNNDGSWKVSLH